MPVLTEKHCPACKTTLPHEAFYSAPSQRDGLTSLCRECTKQRNREYLANLTPEKVEARRARARNRSRERRKDPAYRATHRQHYHDNAKRYREQTLVRKYGIDLATYEAMLAAQGGTCALCPATTGGGKIAVLHVDHCHTTGKVRGLLCAKCNTTLGKFGDDPARLRAAADYLEAHK